jgi:xylan 1,4-beta-xylosidase
VAHSSASAPAPGEVRCHARVGPFTRTTALHPVPDGAVLRIDAVADPAGHGPDVLRLGLEEHGEHVAIAELDGRYLSTEVAGGFTGRVIGLYAAEGTVAFDWFEYAGSDAG